MINFEPIELDLDQVDALYTKMSQLVSADLDRQYSEGKISGATYAETYARLMNSVVAGSMDTIAKIQISETNADRELKKAEYGVKDGQIKNLEKDLEVKDKQIEEIDKESLRRDCQSEADCAVKEEQKLNLEYDRTYVKPEEVKFTKRRTLGFDDNVKLKMLETQANMWGVMYASGMLTCAPSVITSDDMSRLYCDLATQLGIECTVEPINPGDCIPSEATPKGKRQRKEPCPKSERNE